MSAPECFERCLRAILILALALAFGLGRCTATGCTRVSFSLLFALLASPEKADRV